MSIRRVVPNIHSEHTDASREFYVGLFGFTVAMDMGWIATLVSPANPTAQISILGGDESSPGAGFPEIQLDGGGSRRGCRARHGD